MDTDPAKIRGGVNRFLRSYGVARLREGSRRNGIGGVNRLLRRYTRGGEVFLNSQWRRDAARPARAGWAVQRLLAARWRGRRRRRRRFGLSDFRFEAAAATLSATGSASPRPDRNSWLRGATDRKSTRLNSRHAIIPYAVLCLSQNSCRGCGCKYGFVRS